MTNLQHHGVIEADKVYTTKTLASILDYKSDTAISAMIDDGLPHFTVGKRTYISGSGFMRYVESREIVKGDE